MALLTTAPSKVADRAPKILAQASKPVAEEKRLNVRLDAEKHERFRRACMRNESDMTTVIQEFIDQYVEKYSR
jgi:predicted HicB family RNase H-like nuclease